jgi:hypothetical protein
VPLLGLQPLFELASLGEGQAARVEWKVVAVVHVPFSLISSAATSTEAAWSVADRPLARES